ncbi:MAG: RagB/SusD family nutrient uptake outer membrane protein [Emticicia sp.]|uniref:RagB/SusD family nutrient uptake outer membrane protein n=1 Tax=Emticicia sp. TaxID=1930953 RepID=UPI003BA59481
MKINKLKGIALGGLLLLSTSCQDLLKETVVSQIGNDYMNTAKGFEDATRAAYSSLRTFYGTQLGLTLTEYGTDIYATGADGAYKGFHFYDNQIQPTVDYLAILWDELYRGINTCNAIIGRASITIPGISDATKKLRVAEAKFLRAHYYYILHQQYGPVELRLTETTGPTKDTKRNSDAEVYAQIIKDCNEAIADLENKAHSTDYGRATRASAEALLAKVYLAKAYGPNKAADDFQKAADLCTNLITKYNFRLLDDFAAVHDENNQLNSEVVFAVQYTADQIANATNVGGEGGGGNNLHLFFGMVYDIQAGMVRDVFWGRPFRRLRPTSYCLNTVFGERVNDSRYKKSFRDTWLCNNPGSFNTSFDNSKSRVTFAAGDTTIFIPGFEMSREERAKRKYQVLVPSAYNESLFPPLQKFFDTKRSDRTEPRGSRDYFVWRLADIYLMRAEANLQLGKRAEATADVNIVRQRAGWPGRKEAMRITEAQMTFDFLVEERARELAGEQMRWLDLKRWGLLVERVKRHNPQAQAVADKHYVRPIPQTQIDRSNPGAFAQNPGY